MPIEFTLGTALAGVGAGIAIGFAGFGSAFGQGIAAASSVGAIAQDGDFFARGLIFTVLMETQAIYGFLIAILLMVFSGMLDPTATGLDLGPGLVAVGAGIAIGFAAFGSALGQGIAAASSVGAIVEDEDMFARGLIFTVLMETQAIYGFLIAILLMVFSGMIS